MRKTSNRRVVSILAMAMAVGGAALLQVGCIDESQGTEIDADESSGLEAESQLAPTGDEPAPQAGCGAALDVFVTGGEAHWTITCSSAGATIDGFVIDTLADGRCAYVKAFNDVTGARVFSPDARACPSGTRTHFNGLAPGARSISAYLYVL